MSKVLLWIAVIYSVIRFAYSGVYFAVGGLGGDFRTAFPGPLLFRVSQYWPSLAQEWWGPPTEIWNYGPMLHFVTVPFILATTRAQAMTVFLLMDYLLLGVAFYLWVQFLFQGFRKPLEWAGLACVWLNFFPLLEAIVGREIEILELFLITVGIWALRQKRQIIAGAVMGLAAMTKFLPLIFLPYLLIKGYRKAFWVASAVVLAIAALTQLLLGFEHSVTLTLAGEEVGGGGFSASAYANQALGNVLAKMFTPWDLATPHPHGSYFPHLVVPIGMILHGVVLLGCGWLLVKWRHHQLLELECALLAVVMVLVAPHANTYYLVLALPAISVGFASLTRHAKETGLLLKVAIIGAPVLSGLFLVPMKVFEVITGVQGMLVARLLQFWSLPAFGGILSALALVGLHRMERRLPAGLSDSSSC